MKPCWLLPVETLRREGSVFYILPWNDAVQSKYSNASQNVLCYQLCPATVRVLSTVHQRQGGLDSHNEGRVIMLVR
jgi:hypothetical protein